MRHTPRALTALALALAPAAAFAQANPSPYTSATRYDAMGRTTGTISADPDDAGSLTYLAVRNSYDAAGRLIRVETGSLAVWQSEAVAPAGWTGFTVARTVDTLYDAMGRKARDTASAGGAVLTLTQYSYDIMGRLECTAARMNPAAFGSVPGSACTPGTVGSYGPDRITRTIYDAAGQRLQLREGVGSADEGTEATWGYNFDGQVTTVIDGNGNRAELRYDGQGRQDRWTFPSPTRPPAFNDSTPELALSSAGSVNAGDYEEYGYDAAGNRTSFRKRDGSVLNYSYDALNRMTVKDVPARAGLTADQVRDVHYGYDLRGLQTYARFDGAGGEGVANAYDGFGRLASHSINLGGTLRTLSYRWDANGNRTRITHPADAAHPDGAFFGTDHDALNRPTWLTDPIGSAVAVIAYDGAGHPNAIGRPGATTGINVAGDGRLLSLTHYFAAGLDVQWSFTHNPAQQIASETRSNDAYAWTRHYAVSRTYTANGLNQYSTAGGAGFTYDANGNLITAPGPLAGQTITYTYDVENRLVAASAGVTLRYDPLGRLFQLIAGASTTTFLYDGDALVAEYDSAGTLTARYVHSEGADVPLVQYDGAGTAAADRRNLLADRQGSIVAVSNNAGVRLAVNAYDEYGIPATGNTGRFAYTGQIWLAELGMYHYKTRIYSPTLGRFLQTDPVGYQDQFNLYTYVGNDPVNLVDATGQFSLTVTSRQEGPRVVNMINPLSQTQYRYDGVTRGIYTDWGAQPNLSGSAEYSRNIDAMIQSPESFVADIAATVKENGMSYNVDSEFHGGVTYVGDNLNPVTTIVVSGHFATGVPAEGGGTLVQAPGEVLMHEVARHAAPRATGETPSNRTENKIRDEVHLPRRASDPGHPY